MHEVCIARFSFGYIYVKRLRLYIYIKIPRIARLAYGEQRSTVKGVGDRFRERPLHTSHVSVFIYKNTQNSKVSLWRTAGDRKGRGRPFQGMSPAYIARLRLYIYVKKVRIVRIPSCSQPYRQGMICKTSAAYIARLRLYIYKNTQNNKVNLWRTAGDRKGRGRPFQGTSPAYIARFRLYIYVKKVRIVRIPSCSQPYRQEMIRLYANSR